MCCGFSPDQTLDILARNDGDYINALEYYKDKSCNTINTFKNESKGMSGVSHG